jgi:hypothetical protein
MNDTSPDQLENLIRRFLKSTVLERKSYKTEPFGYDYSIIEIHITLKVWHKHLALIEKKIDLSDLA